jgi:hypothetical protein
VGQTEQLTLTSLQPLPVVDDLKHDVVEQTVGSSVVREGSVPVPVEAVA